MKSPEMGISVPQTPQIENEETRQQINKLKTATKQLREEAHPIYLQILKGGFFKGEKDGYQTSEALESWKKGKLADVIQDSTNLEHVNDLIQKYADLTKQIKTNEFEIRRLEGKELPIGWERYIDEI